MEKQGRLEDSAIANIVANQCNIAIELFSQNEDYEDGKLVKALQLTGVFKSVLDSIKSKTKAPNYQEQLEASLQKIKELELTEIDKDLHTFAKEESEAFFSQGKPLLAAASYLSVSEFR